MSQFSVSDAAFEGFRITRENPVAVALWSLVFLAASVVSTLAMGSSDFATFIALASKPGVDPMTIGKQLAPMLPSLMRAALILMGVQIVLQAIVQTAVNRAVLRPSDRAFGYLRLGLDELRTLAVLVITTVLLFAIYFVGVMIFGMLAGLLGPIGGLLGFLVLLGMLALLLITDLRLSLAVSASFAERRIALRRSLELTGGKFWLLLGAYFIAVILFVLVLFLGAAVSAGVRAALGQAGPTGLAAELAQTFTPVGLVLLVMNAILSTLAYVILFAVSAGIYKTLVDDPSALEAF